MALYLEHFYLPNEDQEWRFFINQKSRAFTTYYPFQLFPAKEFSHLSFEPITIFYGGNGSGKSTLLNIIAEKLQLQRGALYNRSSFFEDYLKLCDFSMRYPLPRQSAIITSDEIFDYMLNLRALNEGIDRKRVGMFDDYLATKFSDFHYRDLSDYDQLKKVLETRRKTQSRYVRENLMKNVPEESNGESALRFFQERLLDDQLYLLDEPENSLSPANQLLLVNTLAEAARFFGCQFIIATHSPFVLSLKGAKIYDLDEVPAATKKWTELAAVQVYANFFQEHQAEFN